MNTPVRQVLILLSLFALSAVGYGAQNNRQKGSAGGFDANDQQQSQDQATKEQAPMATPRSNPQIVYPYDFALSGTEGTAEIAYDVDDQGVPHNIKVVKASKPEFGKSIAAAIESVRFTPPQKDGKAVAVTKQPLKFSFTKAAIDADLIAELKKPNPEFVATKEVDGGMKPLRLPPPLYPEAMSKANVNQGTAAVEFIIDTDGSVHLPKIVSASSDDFGWAAATCVLTWRFVPPTKDGKPVRVHVAALPFPFYASKADADAAAAAASASAAKK